MKQVMLLMLVMLVMLEQSECFSMGNMNYMNKSPQPCCAPSQFEGMVGGEVGIGNGQLITNIIAFSYDESNKRTVMNGTQIIQGKFYNFKVLSLFKEKRQYVVNGTTGECLYYPAETFTQACVPEGAQHFGPLRIGIGGDSMMIDSWNIQLPNGSGSLSTTPTKCVFTSELAAGTTQYGKETVGYLATYGFFDVTLGIKNPNVFTPPSNCKPGYEQHNLMKPFFL